MKTRALLCLLLALAGCASQHAPTVVERSLTGPAPTVHVVTAGETLYAIALRYDKDYHELARINGLDPNFTIRPGQRLHLVEPARAVAAPGKPASVPARAASDKQGQKPDKTATRESRDGKDKTFVVKKPASVPEPTPGVIPVSSASTSLAWTWPARGQVIGRFGEEGITGKGLDIAGRRGDSVLAAAAGTVVYAGSGLVGYGRLLIIRHDDNFISAYAYNDRFLVHEGERVQPGQAIAVMGASGTDRDKLHFEIREHGKPVDPLHFLPAREEARPKQ